MAIKVFLVFAQAYKFEQEKVYAYIKELYTKAEECNFNFLAEYNLAADFFIVEDNKTLVQLKQFGKF